MSAWLQVLSEVTVEELAQPIVAAIGEHSVCVKCLTTMCRALCCVLGPVMNKSHLCPQGASDLMEETLGLSLKPFIHSLFIYYRIQAYLGPV